MNREQRIALKVEHTARNRLFNLLSPDQRRALRDWLNRAAEYKRVYPTASFDETRAAIRLLRRTPMVSHNADHRRQINDAVRAAHATIHGDEQ